MNKRIVKIGLIQIASENGNAALNLERGISMIKQAAEQGANIVCLPELFYGGYFLDSYSMNKIAENENGILIQTLSKLAAELKIFIIAGYAESTEIVGRIYNSAVFIDDKGKIIGNMRKVYPWGQEKLKFRAGDKFPVYDTPFGKIGIMICYDTEFPEPARIMALKGAEIVFVPAVWSVKAQPRWNIDLAGNALFNLMYMVGVNTVGEELCGMSQIYGPDGILRIRASQTEEQVLVHEIDLDEVRKVRSEIPYLNDFLENTFTMDALKIY